jgi:hypothetical protein
MSYTNHTNHTNHNDPCGDDTDAIEAFVERQLIDRPFVLRKYLKGKAYRYSAAAADAAASDWLDTMANRANDPELVRKWMQLALTGDAAGLLTAVAQWTEYWIGADTDDWITEQLDTGNWIELERAEAQED